MQIICVIDGIIVAVGIYSFGVKAALYAIVAIYVTSKVSDTLMEVYEVFQSGIYRFEQV